jgi:hypothetical protein
MTQRICVPLCSFHVTFGYFLLKTFFVSLFFPKTCFNDCELSDDSTETEVSARSVRWKAEKKHDGMGNNVWRTEHVNE